MLPKTACILVGTILVLLGGRVSAQELTDDRYAQNPQPTRPPAAATQSSVESQVQLQQKQIEVQQQQIETLQGMVRQLQQTVPPATVGDLQSTTAELESRSVRAAGREQELARAVDA